MIKKKNTIQTHHCTCGTLSDASDTGASDATADVLGKHNPLLNCHQMKTYEYIITKYMIKYD
jgi:hypothetical protein